MIELTDWAAEVLARSQEAARRLNPDAQVRVARAGDALATSLVEGPERGDVEVRAGEATVLVAGDLDGLIDVESPHDRLALRPRGSAPNERPV